MDETFKAALRAAVHRWVDSALDSEHGDVDVSRQPRAAGSDIWYLQLRWTDDGDDDVRSVLAVVTACRDGTSDRF